MSHIKPKDRHLANCYLICEKFQLGNVSYVLRFVGGYLVEAFLMEGQNPHASGTQMLRYNLKLPLLVTLVDPSRGKALPIEFRNGRAVKINRKPTAARSEDADHLPPVCVKVRRKNASPVLLTFKSGWLMDSRVVKKS